MGQIENLERIVKTACQSDSIVLITGDTGTGKSTLAKEIHKNSPRKAHPFVHINLASLHEGTLEAELFGYERGAFTGADRKREGRLESAQGGTVFFDEIGELTFRMQARLLEFLQTRKIIPLGGNREITLNVRIIAATNIDLNQAVERGEFRQDLLQRLRVIPIKLKSLRERMEDFDDLFHQCLKNACLKYRRNILRISESTAQKLESYSWPGNIRELNNVIEYAVQFTDDEEIDLEDLPLWFLSEEKSAESKTKPILGVAEIPLTFDYRETLENFQKKYLTVALQMNHGRINRTAKNIGLNKSTFIRLLKSHEIFPKMS